MAAHTVLVRTQRPDEGWWNPGDVIEYSGPPNWKFEPVDPQAKAGWETEIADPERVEVSLSRNPISGVFPSDQSVHSPSRVRR